MTSYDLSIATIHKCPLIPTQKSVNSVKPSVFSHWDALSVFKIFCGKTYLAALIIRHARTAQKCIAHVFTVIILSVTNQVKRGQMLIRARLHHWPFINGALSVLKREQAVLVLHFLHCFQAVTTALAQVDREKIYQWINELSSPETRENALLELSKKRESVPDLAPMLWHSCGTIAALLQVSQDSVFHR